MSETTKNHTETVFQKCIVQIIVNEMPNFPLFIIHVPTTWDKITTRIKVYIPLLFGVFLCVKNVEHNIC